ncbi:hypothetical protein BGZ79_011025 [Entomortierella chlamydospora]|nr:hypothetical protein BGZ79_011025 [Entomortierella chlamydospora]
MEGSSSTRTATTTDVLGPRLVTNDFPVPVQAVDEQNHIAYTFVYDAFNPNLGMQLWSFATTQLPNNIAQTKNTTMVTSISPPTNGTNSTVTAPVESVVLAPFMDPGNAVYLNGMIIVVGGGRQGVDMKGDNVDPDSGLYKTDRCFTYTVSSGLWSVRSLTVAGGGDFPLSRRFAALVAVGNKIYMHGGNTTETVPTVTYEKDLWILDTQTWQWTKGPDSQNGRAYHTLINYQNTLISVSGFEFETTTTKSASNAFIMVYDLNAGTWGPQFGTINKTFFQEHAIAIIAGSVSAFLVLVVVAAAVSRLWRKHTGRKPIGSGLVRKFTNKPFLATTGARKSSRPNPTVAAAQLSGMSNPYPSQRGHETHIDLSALPRVNDSSTFDQHTSPTHQFDPYGSMQHVPLMADDALENQGHELDPYKDGDEAEEKDMRPLSHATPHFVPSGVSETGSSLHPGQTVGTSGAPVAARRMTGDATDRGPISE